MYCKFCGKPLDKDARFCPNCGKTVANDMPEPRSESKQELSKPDGISRKKIIKWVIAGLALTAVCSPIVLIGRALALDSVLNPENRTVAASSLPVSDSEQELEDPSPEPLSDENVETPQDEVTTENVLIFSEGFDSDDTIAVPVFPDEYMHFYRPKGFGYIESTSYTGVLPVMFPEIKLDDFIVEFDFKMPEAFDDSRCGLIFRSDTDIADGLDEYYALFLYPKINQVKMGVWIDDDWASSEYMNPDPPFYQGSDLNHVSLEVSGESQEVYINGVFLANFTNQTLKEPGLIGLFLYPSDAIDEGEVDYVFFDNFQVFEN